MNDKNESGDEPNAGFFGVPPRPSPSELAFALGEAMKAAAATRRKLYQKFGCQHLLDAEPTQKDD